MFVSNRFGGPEAVIPDEGVGKYHELSENGGQHDPVPLSGGAQTLAESPEGRVRPENFTGLVTTKIKHLASAHA